MDRRNFFTAAMALGLAVIPRKVEAAPPALVTKAKKLSLMPTVTKTHAEVEEMYRKSRPAIRTSYEGPDVVNIPASYPSPDFYCSPEAVENRKAVEPEPKLSGASGKSLVCRCPACLGSGFRGIDRDECGYCHMNGHLVTTETFGMYNGEGNAEVWRAMVWHEWSERNWRESDGPKPWLPGMLCNIGEKHPEVFDTAVRENIFVWLEKRFDKTHAKGQIEAWAKEENLKRSREYAEKVMANPGTMVACPLFRPFPQCSPS